MSDTKDEMRYDLLVQQALRGVVRSALERVVRDGLPGDHHFYIAFSTIAPGVQLSAKLRERYPEEMTIVLQHEFLDLEVNADRFSVKLFFNRVPEALVVPFTAIRGFHDPSVHFTLQFEVTGEPARPKRRVRRAGGNDDVPADESGTGKSDGAASSDSSAEATVAENSDGAEVVSLDQFRKK